MAKWNKSIIHYKNHRGFLWQRNGIYVQVWKPYEEWLVITTGEVTTTHKSQKAALERAKYMRVNING